MDSGLAVESRKGASKPGVFLAVTRLIIQLLGHLKATAGLPNCQDVFQSQHGQADAGCQSA